MPTLVHEFAWPDRVVIGTVGVPGARTFYLQVRAGSQIVSVALEKQQSALLAEKIDEILDQLITLEGNPFSVPTGTPIELVDNEPLESVEEQFRTGAMSLGWDPTTAQVVVEAYPITDVDADPDDDSLDQDGVEVPEMLLVRMPVGTARAFTKRTREVVGAGRPLCPLCGNPMDADGHICTPPMI
ncbi:putative repeat protein (TIGR03847 family) [Pseudarthrobacter defluvii]|uniref:DUF3090 domain-containing protein n=1 Tax=Pseudarthrobacter defluvii TaxID=410837 RepID=UPI002788CCF5|nr:DUF3090 domain-containing protein [Pseudarthrobacter defluvii]MDQ0768899.1 putative repeat protein (TIGR03847 family) [Pseudarthrobacter defluvii]